MERAGVTRLERNLFANTQSLNIFNMQFNAIQFVHRETFDNTRQLQQLLIGGNPCGDGASLNFYEIQYGDLTNILPLLSRCFGVTPITCNYTNNTQILGISDFNYTCTIESQTLEEKQRSELKQFGGSHLLGMGSDNVINLLINYSNIPFFLTEMFTSFPNLRAIEITNGGLQQIRSNDFLNGGNLESIYMQYNNLKVLNGGIFAGLSRLQKLSLGKNEIERVDGNAFSGLTSLRLLYLQENRIRRLHRNTFNSLRQLRDLNLRANYLTRITSLLFFNNSEVGVIMMDSNQIAAVDERFLDYLPRLAVLNMLNNRCVNALFDGNRNRINEGLRRCYEEFQTLPADDTRQVIMEIDGEVGLIDNDGRRIEL
jgi:Leucine-rich repeat (LRR) protein